MGDAAVVLVRGRPTGLGPLSSAVGPLHAADLGGWTAVSAADPDADVVAIARALSQMRGRGRRGDVVAALFTEEVGEVTGLVLCAGGDLLEAHLWGSPAVDAGAEKAGGRPGDPVEPLVGDAAVIAAVLGVEEDESLLRALLRRSPDRATTATELVALLRLPPAVVDLVLGRTGVPDLAGAQRVHHGSFLRGLLADSSAGPAGGLWTSRAALVAARGALAVAGVALVAVLLELATGAVVGGPDPDPAAGRWAVLAVLAAASNAGYLLLRSRRGSQHGGGGSAPEGL